jgi:DNA-binding FrmR family transcriptional regulator
MVETDRYCVDIITQIAAARAALKRVSDELLQDHVAHCVEDAIESGNRKEQRTKVTELLVLLGKLST